MNRNFEESSTDRISLTLVFALLVHGALVLGISFTADLDFEPTDSPPALDVILVQKQTAEAPEEADFLAQASQLGGGTVDEAVRPTAPLTGPALKPERGITPVPSRAAAPRPEPQDATPVLTRERSSRTVDRQETRDREPARNLPSAAELLLQAREIARLEAELNEELQAYAQRDRHKYISANTQEYLYASYMQAWVDKVERIGNLNYPAEARRENIQGSLVLDVAIGWSGEVQAIRVLKSSGHEMLDQAAIRIVRLGAPYAPLSDQIRAQTDILHITRTWRFLPGDQFESD